VRADGPLLRFLQLALSASAPVVFLQLARTMPSYAFPRWMLRGVHLGGYNPVMVIKEVRDERRRSLAWQIDDILRRVDAMRTLDSRSADEILGYDEHGLPR